MAQSPAHSMLCVVLEWDDPVHNHTIPNSLVWTPIDPSQSAHSDAVQQDDHDSATPDPCNTS